MLDFLKAGSAKIHARLESLRKEEIAAAAKAATARREAEDAREAWVNDLASEGLSVSDFERKKRASDDRAKGAEDALVATKEAILRVEQKLAEARHREEVTTALADLESVRAETDRTAADLRMTVAPFLASVGAAHAAHARWEQVTSRLRAAGVPTEHQDPAGYRHVESVSAGGAITKASKEALEGQETWPLGPLYLSVPKGSATTE